MTKRVFDAECGCFERDLKCFHSIKEKTVSLGDSTMADSTPRPNWRTYHRLERNSGTQRYNASKT